MTFELVEKRLLWPRVLCAMSQNGDVLVSEFDFHLPDELIARRPLADRAASRMLHLHRGHDLTEDRAFRDFPELLRPDDLLVFNNTKVLTGAAVRTSQRIAVASGRKQNPAAKEFLRGKVEVLLTKQLSDSPMVWEALVHPGPQTRNRRASLLRRRCR